MTSVGHTRRRMTPHMVRFFLVLAAAFLWATIVAPAAHAVTPTVTVSAPAASSYVSGSAVTLTCAASIGSSKLVTGISFAIDGTTVSTQAVTPNAASSTKSYSWNSTGASNGSHSLVCSATTTSASGSSAARTFTVDNAVPTSVSVTAPTAASYVTGSASFSVTASDTVGVTRLDWMVDGAQVSTATYTSATTQAKTYTWDTTAVTNGSHLLAVIAYDAAGNSTSTVLSPTTVNVDNLAPTSSITAPVAAAYVSGTVTVTADGTDAHSGLTNAYLYVDGVRQVPLDQSFAATASATRSFSWDVSALGAGSKSLVVRYVDAVGKTVDSSAVSVTIDASSPTISQTAPSPSAYVRGSIAWSGLAADDGGVVQVKWFLDDATCAGAALTSTVYASFTSATKTYTWDTTSVANGSHTLAMGVVDGAGHAMVCSSSRTVTVDNAAPVATISSPLAAAVVSGTTTITANGTDASGSVSGTISIDGVVVSSQAFASNANKNITYSWNTAAAALGSHTITSTFTDAAGNTGSSATTTVVIDQTAPTASISAPATGTLGGTVAWTAAVTDDAGVTSVEYYIDGVLDHTENISATTAASVIYSWDASVLADGTYSLTVKSFDAASRNSGVSAAVSVTVSHAVPTSAITSPSTGAAVNGSLSVEAAGTSPNPVGLTKLELLVDNVVVVTDNIAGAPFSDTRTNSVNTALLSNGAHTLKARFTNSASLTADSSITINVDNTAPTATITAPLASATVKGTQNITVSVADAVGVVSTEWYLDGGILETQAFSSTTSATKTYAWNTLATTEGAHSLTAKAYDASGNVVTSAATSVTVDWSVYCDYNAVTDQVDIQLGAGEVATVYAHDDTDGGYITVNTRSCDSGAATIDNTTQINVTGSAGSEAITIDGDTFEGPATPIRFVIDLGTGSDSLTAANLYGARIHAGRNATTGKKLISWSTMSSSAADQDSDLEFTGVETVTLQGSTGNDVLDGSPYIASGCTCDMPDAANYALVLSGGKGADWMRGGTSYDSFAGGGNGSSVTAVDTVSYGGRTAAVTASINGAADDGDASGEFDSIGSDVENLVGGTGADTLSGSSTANKVEGGGGTDTVSGEAGADRLYGGMADGSGAADGADTIYGGSGNDALYPDPNPVGGESYWGGSDNDTVSYSGQSESFTISLDDVANDGMAGETDNVHTDVENVYGGTGSDTITGSSAANVLVGAAGAGELATGGVDTISGGAGNDILKKGLSSSTASPGDVFTGGSGSDTVVAYYALTADALTITLDGVANDGESGEGDNIATDIEIVFGARGNDAITGSSSDNKIYGMSGDDNLHGGGGNDQIDGSLGDDRMYGEDGNDRLTGSDGNDILSGSTGTDQFTGNGGNDVMYANDGVKEKVTGAAGDDSADTDSLDILTDVEHEI